MIDFSSSEIRSVLDRFKKAGWLNRCSAVDDEFSVDFTPVGLQRMDAFVEHLHDMRASGFEPTALATGAFGEILTELIPPNFSESEFIALIGMIESFSSR